MLAVRVLPAILLEAPDDADAAALPEHLAAGLGQLRPGLDLEERHFLLGLVVLPIEAVRRDGERADLVAVRDRLELGVPRQVAFDDDGIEVVQHASSLDRPAVDRQCVDRRCPRLAMDTPLRSTALARAGRFAVGLAGSWLYQIKRMR